MKADVVNLMKGVFVGLQGYAGSALKGVSQGVTTLLLCARLQMFLWEINWK